MNLKEHRDNIDILDRQIVELLEKRFDYVKLVADYKLKNDMEIFDNKREGAVLNKIEALTKNSEYIPYTRDVYADIMNSSKNLQKNLISVSENSEQDFKRADCKSVAFQGVRGSYGEEAMLNYFGGNDFSSQNFRTFEMVAEAVVEKRADCGILPVENSSTGTVNVTMDLLAKYDLHIVGEYIMPISHNLVAKRGIDISDIKQVFSHEQGFLQCADFLKNHPDWEQIEYLNTAISAQMVSESDGNTRAAISSRRAADIYNLEILKEEINGSKFNSTRFLVFSAKPQIIPNADKISIMFSLPHRSGTLFDAMRLLNNQELNLLKIESRPGGKPWEYIFFIDFEGNLSEPRCKRAIDDLKNITGTFRLLGNYLKDSKTV